MKNHRQPMGNNRKTSNTPHKSIETVEKLRGIEWYAILCHAMPLNAMACPHSSYSLLNALRPRADTGTTHASQRVVRDLGRGRLAPYTGAKRVVYRGAMGRSMAVLAPRATAGVFVLYWGPRSGSSTPFWRLQVLLLLLLLVVVVVALLSFFGPG